jgi:hypothetical protein
MKKYLPIAILLLTACQANKPMSKADSIKAEKLAIADSIADKKQQIADAKADSISNLPPIPSEPEAEQVMNTLVKAQSVDPDDVEFINGNAKYELMPDSTYVFIGYAKMPNQLGTKTPMAYYVQIKWKGGDWQSADSWDIISCKITSPDE